MSNPQASAQDEDCVDTPHATQVLRLNTSALLDPNSLTISLSSSEIPIPFRALVDSGSTHCFIDIEFVTLHKLSARSVPPIPLKLFDGSCNSVITLVCDLPICFPCGTLQSVAFYVTHLDSSCLVVCSTRRFPML